jgi:hypothetical protein
MFSKKAYKILIIQLILILFIINLVKTSGEEGEIKEFYKLPHGPTTQNKSLLKKLRELFTKGYNKQRRNNSPAIRLGSQKVKHWVTVNSFSRRN